MKKLALMCIVASTALGLQMGTAFAGTPGDSEIDQYTESLPNGGGNQPTNSPDGTNPGATDPSATTDSGLTDGSGSGGSGGSGSGAGSGGDDAEKLGSFIQSSSPGSSGTSDSAPLINASGAGDDSDSFLDTVTGSGSAGPILPILLIVAILGGSAYFVRMRRSA